MEQKHTNKTYITGGDIYYMPLIEVMVKSLTKYLPDVNANIIIYTFNCDYSIDGFECKRLDVPAVNYKHGREFDITKIDNSLFFAKYYATLDAFKEYEYVCWLDGDSFILQGIERIWEFCKDVNVLPHPLFMHYHNRDISFWRKFDNPNGITLTSSYGHEASILFGVNRNPYKFLVATGLYLAHRKHASFFEDVLKKWEIVKFSSCYVWADKHAFSEERLTNIKMWEIGGKVGLPISWVNASHKFELFKDFRLNKLLADGFDVMFFDDSHEEIMIHGPNPMISEKTGEHLSKAYEEYQGGADKLMIVAHPDDELIFGGYDLLSESGWKIVCLTNQDNEDRREEFVKVVSKLGVKESFIYDFPDDTYENFPQEEVTKIIKMHITEKNWKKILTHNSIGEYGHPHHYQVNQIVKDITHGKKMWVFHKGERLPGDILSKKLEILKEYDYAKDFIEQIRTHNGRWFIEKDMTTNYVEHGRSVEYVKDNLGEYVPCFMK